MTADCYCCLMGCLVETHRRFGEKEDYAVSRLRKSYIHSIRYGELVFYRDRRVVTVCQFNKRGSVSVTD